MFEQKKNKNSEEKKNIHIQDVFAIRECVCKISRSLYEGEISTGKSEASVGKKKQGVCQPYARVDRKYFGRVYFLQRE